MTAYNLEYEAFQNGRTRGVSNIGRDASGNLISWIENGFNMLVARDSSGNPISLIASGTKEYLKQVFSFDSLGHMISTSGPQIPTALMTELIGNVLVGGSKIQTLIAAYTVVPGDDGSTLVCSVPLTITYPSGLVPQPRLEVDCPATGVVTIASDGTETLNGATTSITRARTANYAGFRIRPHFFETNSVGISGA